MGCAIGCGGVLLLSMVGCISCVIWLDRPGDVMDPQRLLAADTTGYVEWTVDLEDHGTEELLLAMLATLQETQREGLPDSGVGRILGKFQQMSNKSAERDLRKAFPLVVAASLRPVAGVGDEFIIAGSLRGTDHQLVFLDVVGGLFLGPWIDERTIRYWKYKDEKIVEVERGHEREPYGVFIRGGDIYFTSSVDQARYAVDLLRGAGAAPEGTPAVDRWFRVAPDTPLRGALSNRTGELRRLWDSLTEVGGEPSIPTEVWESVEGVLVSGGFGDNGVFAIELEFDVTEAEAAAAAEAPLRAALERELQDSLFHVSDVGAVNDRLRVVLLTDPLVEKLEAIAPRR